MNALLERSHDGVPWIRDEVDGLRALADLKEVSAAAGVQVHAYALLDNQLHLLLTPRTAQGLPLMMQGLGRRYVRQFNDIHQRSGTLWEGRYRSTVLQADPHLLSCMTYLDLLPVQQGMVTQAALFPWSSHRHYIGQAQEKRLVPHPVYWGLGNTPFAREAAYAEMVHAGLSGAQIRAIESAVLHGWALGDAAFIAALQQQTERRVSKARPGRPAKR